MALSKAQHQHVNAWRNSGLTKSAYSREQGLNIKTFYRWCRQSCAEETVSTTPTIIPVHLEPPAALSSQRIAVTLAQGHTLELPTTISAHWLAEFFQCLG